MNNTAESDLFFGFPKVKWLKYTGKVGKCTSYRCRFFVDTVYKWKVANTNRLGPSASSKVLWQSCVVLVVHSYELSRIVDRREQ